MEDNIIAVPRFKASQEIYENVEIANYVEYSDDRIRQHHVAHVVVEGIQERRIDQQQSEHESHKRIPDESNECSSKYCATGGRQVKKLTCTC